MWNPLNDLRYEVEKERALMPSTGLNESPGLWNSFMGAISGASTEGVNRKRDAISNEAANRVLESKGYTREQLGISPTARLTEGGANSRIAEYLENKADAKDTKNFERSLVPLTKQLEATSEANRLQLEATLAQGRNQITSENNRLQATLANNNAQFAHTSRENNLNRIHERELADGRNDLSLQISIMQNDLADKRMQYDRETARLDRRDRAIAQLMQGLGQLGGAFAL